MSTSSPQIPSPLLPRSTTPPSQSKTVQSQSLTTENISVSFERTTPVITLQETFGSTEIMRRLALHPEVKQKTRMTLSRLLDSFSGATDSPEREVNYHFAEGRSSGRLYADGGLSLQSMERRARNTLADGKLCDIDMVNAYPTLLSSWCARNNVNAPLLGQYVRDREDLIESTMQHYRTSRGAAKKLFLAIINGGSVKQWQEENYVTVTSKQAFLDGFVHETKSIRETIWDMHPERQLLAKQLAKRKSRIRGYYANPKATLLTHVLEELECDYLMAMREFFALNGFQVSCLIFDGLMLRMDATRPITRAVLDRCVDFAKEKTGFTVNLEQKPFDDLLSLDPFCTMIGQFTAIASTRLIDVNGKYVADFAKGQSAQIELIKSYTGSGKTTYVSAEFARILKSQPNKRFLVLSHRRSICAEHFKKFGDLGFIHYEDKKAPKADRIITTLDSLVRFVEMNDGTPFDTIYIDEIESLIQHLFGSTLKTKRDDTYTGLLCAIHSASRVICSDADLGDLSLTFFKTILDYRAIHAADAKRAAPRNNKIAAVLFHNHFKAESRQIHMVHSKSTFFDRLEETLSRPGAKVFIGTDSKKQAQYLSERIKTWYECNGGEERTVLLYTSEDGDRSDLSDANLKWAAADVVVCSPSVVTATDYSNHEHPFTAVFGFYANNGFTMGAQDVLQQLVRPRIIAKLPNQEWDMTIYVEDPPVVTNTRKYPQNIEEISKHIEYVASTYENHYSTASTAGVSMKDLLYTTALGERRIRNDDVFVQSYLRYIRNRNLSKNQLATAIEYMLKLKGHTVTHVAKSMKYRAIGGFDWMDSEIPIAELGSLASINEYTDVFDSLAKSARLNGALEEIFSGGGSKPKQLDRIERVFQIMRIPLQEQALEAIAVGCRELGEHETRIDWVCDDCREEDNNDDELVLDSDILVFLHCHYCGTVSKRGKAKPIADNAMKTLACILTNEPSLKAYLQFQGLCRMDAPKMHIQENAALFVTNCDESILTLLDHMEKNVLRVQRFECLTWTTNQLYQARKTHISIRSDTKSLANGLCKLNPPQSLNLPDLEGKLTSRYDIYNWVCRVYLHFCQKPGVQSVTTTLITTTRHLCKPDKMEFKKIRASRMAWNEMQCEWCGHVKNASAFIKGNTRCDECRNRFVQYTIEEDALSTLKRYIEVVIYANRYRDDSATVQYCQFDDDSGQFIHHRATAKYKLKSPLRLNEPIMQHALTKQTEFHNVWEFDGTPEPVPLSKLFEG